MICSSVIINILFITTVDSDDLTQLTRSKVIANFSISLQDLSGYTIISCLTAVRLSFSLHGKLWWRGVLLLLSPTRCEGITISWKQFVLHACPRSRFSFSQKKKLKIWRCVNHILLMLQRWCYCNWKVSSVSALRCMNINYILIYNILQLHIHITDTVNGKNSAR